MSAKASGADLIALDRAFLAVAPTSRAEFINIVASFASAQAKAVYAAALAPAGISGTAADRGNASVAAGILSGLRGDDAAMAFGMLNQCQMRAVFSYVIASDAAAAAAGQENPGFGDLAAAAGSISDAAIRGRVLGAGMDLIADGRASGHVAPAAAAAMARMALEALGQDGLEELSHVQLEALASALATDPQGPAQALHMLRTMEPSTARDAMIHTLFLETPESAYDADPGLPAVMSDALIGQLGGDVKDRGKLSVMLEALRGALHDRSQRQAIMRPQLDASDRMATVVTILKDAIKADAAKVAEAKDAAARQTTTTQSTQEAPSQAGKRAADSAEQFKEVLKTITADAEGPGSDSISDGLIAGLGWWMPETPLSERVALWRLLDEFEFGQRAYAGDVARRPADVIIQGGAARPRGERFDMTQESDGVDAQSGAHGVRLVSRSRGS